MSFDCAKRVGAFSFAMVLGFAAQAATLDAIQGGVLVSRGGSGYQVVAQPTQLRVGDSVLANPGAAARVVFEDGCAVAVRPGMVFTVGAVSPCAASGPSNPTSGTSTWSDYALPVGLAVVAGGVGIAIAASGGGGGGGGNGASP